VVRGRSLAAGRRAPCVVLIRRGFKAAKDAKDRKGPVCGCLSGPRFPKCSKMLRVEHFRHAGVLHPRPGARDDVPQLASPWFWGRRAQSLRPGGKKDAKSAKR